MAKIKHRFTITYESTIETDTGEILETVIVDKTELKKTTSSSSKKNKVPNDSDIPTLTLEDSKYQLNAAAMQLMEVQADDRIDIKYEQDGTVVIGNDEVWHTHGGNRLTKSGTVALRGSKNEELAKHGSRFTIIAHPNRPGLFILDSGEETKEEPQGDENVNTEDLDFNLENLVDEPDAVEIDSNSLFQL